MGKGSGNTVTKERLIQSALDLFAGRWYETVSIAEICRNASLSNGVFYNYFEKKEEIFKELLDRYLAVFSDRLTQVEEPSISGELNRFLEVIFETGREHRKLFTVYREGQYRFIRYEKKMREICIDYFTRMYDREIDEAEYIFLISAARFVSMRSSDGQPERDRRVLHELLLGGFFTEDITNAQRIFTTEHTPLESPQDTSRNRLIEAGIKLFGRRGYYNVNVYEVAKEAGFSVGTFYLYFGTKEDFLAEIVRTIGARTRHFISINLDTSLNRTEQEIQGMYLFYLHFRHHRSYYSIVLEAEFVVSEEATAYYDKFEQGYCRTLRHIKTDDKKLVGNALMGISHYFGIESIFSKNITDIEATILKIGRLLHTGMPR
ncbi:MAG: TetR/AcrR family transcriptional regulator [Spirochaetaceae bacterium]